MLQTWAWFRYRSAKDPQHAQFIASMPAARRQELDQFVAGYEAKHPGVNWTGQRPQRLVVAPATATPRTLISGLGGAAVEPLWLSLHQQAAHGRTFDPLPVHEALGLQGHAFQSLYHFTIGMPVEDTRLTTEPGYGWERVGAPNGSG